MDITTAKLTKDLAKTLLDGQREKTAPYDTTGVVLRIEDDIAWVSIPGGVDETPVELTMNAKVDDHVQIRVSGGRAWITGNGTSPPTDDTTAIKAKTYAVQAVETADGAMEEASFKSHVFYGSPDDIYENVSSGDYLVDGDEGKTYKWENDEWVLVTDVEAISDRKIENLNSNIFYAYSSSLDGSNLSFDDNTLQYMGMCTTIEQDKPEDFFEYKWTLNPEWARKYADNFLEQVDDDTSVPAIVLKSPDPSTYAFINALFMSFRMGDIEQLKIGYDESVETYGVISKDVFIYGDGAGIKFDNSLEAEVRSKFVFEARTNGHLSLKRY